MRKLGWIETNQRWRHAEVGSFLKEDIVHQKEWKRISHLVRDSFRLWQMENFLKTERHEIKDEQMPQITLERINEARRWSKFSLQSFHATIGAIKSPWVKNRGTKVDYQCKKCGEINPYWNHGWTCRIGINPPQDTMFRRFLWPTQPSDIPLGNLFLKCFDELYGDLL